MFLNRFAVKHYETTLNKLKQPGIGTFIGILVQFVSFFCSICSIILRMLSLSGIRVPGTPILIKESYPLGFRGTYASCTRNGSQIINEKRH